VEVVYRVTLPAALITGRRLRALAGS
jgi:hypothetical protein